MVLHNANQRSVIKVTVCDPCRQLAVPNQIVASQLLVVRLREVRVHVRLLKGEVVALRLGGIPLHGVLGSDGVELVWTLNDVLLDGVVADGQGSAKVACLVGGGEADWGVDVG